MDGVYLLDLPPVKVRFLGLVLIRFQCVEEKQQLKYLYAEIVTPYPRRNIVKLRKDMRYLGRRGQYIRLFAAAVFFGYIRQPYTKLAYVAVKSVLRFVKINGNGQTVVMSQREIRHTVVMPAVVYPQIAR